MTPIALKTVIASGQLFEITNLSHRAIHLVTLSLKAQGRQIYILPLSERGAAWLWEVLSDWRQTRASGEIRAAWACDQVSRIGILISMWLPLRAVTWFP